jgi:clan AA aspartic protease
MMMGKVDNSGRALLSVELRSSVLSTTEELDVWVDTGFTGDLVLPQVLIDELQLPKSGSVDAILADGSQIELNTYTCVIKWFGVERQLEVIANDGDYPLLGVGLLLGKELRVDYRNLKLSLLPAPDERP